MKRLLLKKLIVISRSEQSSLEVPFKKGLNIILGGNKTGKSSLIKSIFTALGCDCSKIEKDWKNLISTYLLYFEYGDEQYCVLRCGKEFSIMKEEKNNYTCVINTEKFQLFCDKLMEIFEVNMQCVISNNSEIINVTTPLLFRFQYIDQDDGWSDIGNEFKNVRYIKDWKGDTNKFITGYLNNDYYKLKAKKIQLSNDKEEKLKELKSNEMFVNSISHDLKKKSQLENLNQLNTVDDVQKKLIKLRNDTDDLRKKEYSIKEKMTRRVIAPDVIENDMQDIAGIRIMCQFVDDIYRVVDLIHQRQDMQVIEERDYIQNAKPSGYRSYHMVIEYSVFLPDGPKKIIAEIQIRTLAMNFWATVEHTLNYKYQGKYPEDISKRLKSTAEAAYKLDEEMSSIKDEVQEAQRIFTKSKGKEQ